MPYDSLKYFCAVAAELNMTRAARKLHLSQQTLSNHVARLEDEYGVRFFERKPHLRLTAAGECCYSHVKKVLLHEEELLSQFDEIRSQRRGRLSIGVTQTRAQTFLPRILPDFIEQNPDVKLDVNVCHVSELGRRLLDGDFDLILTPMRRTLDPRIESLVVHEDQLCLVIPAHFLTPFFDARELDELREAEPERMYRDLITSGVLRSMPYVLTGPRLAELARRFFSEHVPDPHILMELHDTEVLFSLPFAGIGATFLFRSLLPLIPGPERPLAVPLPWPEAAIPLSAAWDREKGMTWPAKRFLDIARAAKVQL